MPEAQSASGPNGNGMELAADGGTTGLITMGLANHGVGDFDFRRRHRACLLSQPGRGQAYWKGSDRPDAARREQVKDCAQALPQAQRGTP